MKWQNVGAFCAGRATDYGELLAVEIEATRKRLIRELGALVALAVAGLFTLSFVSIAIIASAWQTPYFLAVVWGGAAAWMFLSIVSLLVVRAQKPARSLHVLQAELRSDLETIEEALK
jgi:hypothetical protein